LAFIIAFRSNEKLAPYWVSEINADVVSHSEQIVLDTFQTSASRASASVRASTTARLGMCTIAPASGSRDESAPS
jgi:hypothetical protein